MAPISWLTNIFHGPVNICRHHFYKTLVLIVLGLLAAQYGLSVFVYQSRGSYFFFNTSSFSPFYTNPTPTLVTMQASVLTSELGHSQSSKVQGSTVSSRSVLITRNSTQRPSNDDISGKLHVNATVLTTNVVMESSTSSVSEPNGNKTSVTNASSLATVLLNKDNATTDGKLPLCPLVPPKLVGAVKVWTESPTFEELEKMHPELELGGRFRPKDCKSRHKVAIIIPYRDRELHLRMFLHNMHPILQRQQLDYGIYVVEQKPKTKFNRAMLMNVGFVESLNQYDYQCFVFHDVDLLPEDDRNIYSCPEQPRHMSVAIDVFNYKLPYETIFGGVSALTKSQFETINGFSNQFWGWGAEDDDLANRVRYYGFHISRYPTNIARYKMMKHKKDEPNPDRYNKLYKGKQRYKSDGLNSLKYRRLDILFKRLFTWVYVDLEK